MTYNSRRTILSKTKHILDSYWDFNLPVNINSIVENLGLRIRLTSYVENSENIIGRLDTVNNQIIISVKNTTPINTQRFIIAHELAHYILDHGYGITDDKILFKNHFDYKENEANLFALNLLIPEVAVTHLIEKENIKCIDELANYFDVSYEMMKHQLANLGWL